MTKQYFDDLGGDDENKEENPVKPFTYIHQTVVQNIHHYYISTLIEDAHLYADMINKIQTAGSGDIIYLHLNTLGGYLSTGIQIINAMRSSQAHIVASLEGEVASLGTMLFLAADEFLVHENSSMMFHNYTGGVYGKGHEQIAAIKSATTWTRDFMRRLYIPFMTEDEVDRLVKGEDIYMHPPEILERLYLMNEIKAKELEAAENPQPKRRTTKKKTTKKKVAKKKVAKKKAAAKKGTWQYTYTEQHRKERAKKASTRKA